MLPGKGGENGCLCLALRLALSPLRVSISAVSEAWGLFPQTARRAGTEHTHLSHKQEEPS